MNELALFAGAGGGILGGKLLGWRTVCAVEWEPYPASILCARQNDGLLPPFPIWDDIQTFDGRPWRGIVDVVSGGFPCQDISAAGKGDGLDGKRSGMWHEMARVVGEVMPSYVFVENSPMLTTRGGTRVIADLAAMGYDCKWTVMGAADVGANHQRDRIWIVGKATHTAVNRLQGQANQQILESKGRNELQPSESRDSIKMAHTDSTQCKRNQCAERTQTQYTNFDGSGKLADTQDKGDVWRLRSLGTTEKQDDAGRGPSYGSRQWWQSEPNVGRVADGVAARVDRLKAIGNGQVPLCAATAWRILSA